MSSDFKKVTAVFLHGYSPIYQHMKNPLFVKNAIAKYAIPRCGKLYVADITTSPGRRDVILRQVSYT